MPTGPETYVTLQRDPVTGQALTLPAAVLVFSLDLEARGFRQKVDEHGIYRVAPASKLTAEEHAAVVKWRTHLAAVVSYTPPQT